jgi:hypothetical protein
VSAVLTEAGMLINVSNVKFICCESFMAVNNNMGVVRNETAVHVECVPLQGARIYEKSQENFHPGLNSKLSEERLFRWLILFGQI